MASRSWLRMLLRRALLLLPLAVIVAPLVIATPPTVVLPICAPLDAEVTYTCALAATVPTALEPTVTIKPFGAGPVMSASMVTVCEPEPEQVVPLPVLRA